MRSTSRSTRRRAIMVATRGTVGVVALGVAFLAFGYFAVTTPTPPHRPAIDEALVVQVVTAKLVDVPWTWRGYGVARAKRSADVSAQVAAQVVERSGRIDPGAAIAKGEVIVALERDDFEQALAAAESDAAALSAQLEALDVEEESIQAQLALAEQTTALTRRDLERTREAEAHGAARSNEVDANLRLLARAQREEEELRERGVLIPTRRQRLLAQRRRAEAVAATARRDLERTSVRAPIGGVLQEVNAQVGELLAVGDPVARVVDLTTIETPLRMPASALLRLRPGDLAVLRSDGPDDREWEARVVRVEPEVDAGTRTVGVFVELEQIVGDGPTGLLLPGTFVIADVSSSTSAPQILIPRTCVEADRVYVVDAEGRVRVRDVTTSRRLEAALPELHPRETQWTVVIGGLEPGERVIISNLDDLHSGALVDPVDVAMARRGEP